MTCTCKVCNCQDEIRQLKMDLEGARNLARTLNEQNENQRAELARLNKSRQELKAELTYLRGKSSTNEQAVADAGREVVRLHRALEQVVRLFRAAFAKGGPHDLGIFITKMEMVDNYVRDVLGRKMVLDSQDEIQQYRERLEAALKMLKNIEWRIEDAWRNGYEEVCPSCLASRIHHIGKKSSGEHLHSCALAAEIAAIETLLKEE